MSTSPKSKTDFLTVVNKSKVVDPEQLKEWLTGRDQAKPNELASDMVREGLLTRWQAKYLLSGRYRLHLGNYTLLERIRKDEYGDRFVAVHPQLGRNVHVQVLPVELTNDDQRRTDFLKKAGLAGELNHPSLVHVYDIDRQQGRYYLVTEMVAGKPLAQVSPASLDPLQLGHILNDAINGLQHAHRQGVVHGNLSLENMRINESGKLKISQIAMAPLVAGTTDAAGDGCPTPQADLNKVVKLLSQLANEIPDFDDSYTASQFNAILTELKADDADAFETAHRKLTSWIDDQEASGSVKQAPAITKQEPSAQEPSAEPVAAAQALTSSQNEEPSAPTPKAPPGNDQPSDRKSQPTAAANTTASPHRHSPQPTTIWKPIAIAVASIIGTVLVMMTFIQQANSNAKLSAPDEPSRKAAVGNRGGDRQPIAPQTDSFRPNPTPDEPPNQGAQSSTSSKFGQPTGHEISTQDTTAQPKLTELTDPASAKPVQESATVEDTEVVDVGSPAMPRESTDLTGSSTEQSSDQSSATSTKDSAAVDSASDEPAETPPATEEVKPFSKFPDTVDLPESTLVEEVLLGSLDLPPNHLLGLDLLSGSGISRSRVIFQIKRTPSDRQKWNVLLKRRASGDGVAVAQFRKSDQGLHFQWTAAANESRFANYLRNCKIHLKLADQSKWSTLRRPATLPEFCLKNERLAVRVDSAIQWLPDPELLVVELLPWRKPLPETEIEPMVVTSGQPSAIHFQNAQYNRFLWLQVVCDFKTKVTLQANLLFTGADGVSSPVKHGRSLAEIATQMELVAQNAEVGYQKRNAYFERNKDTDEFEGKITKTRKYLTELKSSAKTARKQAAAAAENVNLIPSAFDKPIPLKIWYKLDDHIIVLVDTTGSSAAPEQE